VKCNPHAVTLVLKSLNKLYRLVFILTNDILTKKIGFEDIQMRKLYTKISKLFIGDLMFYNAMTYDTI